MESSTMAPCPPDSELMKAWGAWVNSDEYKYQREQAIASIKDENKEDGTWLDGFLWRCFVEGFGKAGGQTTF